MKHNILIMLALVSAVAAAAGPKEDELGIPLPAFPKAENLIEFYVSAATRNHFFIDSPNLSVGADGVVRYVLVVKTAGGATNTSFEGIDCRSDEYRLYATGHSDGSWARARLSVWRPIENESVNGDHAALSRDYFCPEGLPIADAAAGRAALRTGTSPVGPE
ncbi:MAG TPA: CNP1-like family protein [Rhodocyclaceae bacterium]|nr:CNP1-like family protein [Rhodocyclaceae bacterium]